MLALLFVMIGMLVTSFVGGGHLIMGFTMLVLGGFFMMFKSSEMYIMLGLGLDSLSGLLILLSVWVSYLMVLASKKILSVDSGLFLFYLFSMMLFLTLCFMCTSLLGFYFFFEVVLIPIVLIIFGWGNQPERLQAGVYMLFYTLFGSLPLLVVLLKLWGGNLDLVMINMLGGELSGVWGLFLVLAFLVKMPMFMFHLWLPKAHVEAPVAGSMILAGVLLKLGGYGILRVLALLSSFVSVFGGFIVSLSLVGGVFVGFMCLRQIDVKSLIAYSSVGHMGMVLGGMVTYSNWGLWGAVVLMVGHGLCSSGLFAIANMFYERLHSRSMVLMSGMMLVYPGASLFWFLLCVANMSAPPSMNLLGEILLMGGLVKWSWGLMVLLGLMTFLSAAYSLYLFSFTQHGKSWVWWGVDSVDVQDYLMLGGHLIPLITYIFKMSVFVDWL